MNREACGIGWPARWTWGLAFLAGTAGLALAYGFHEPPLADADRWIRGLLAGAAGGFVLSRLLLLIPLSMAGPRFLRRVLDFVVIAAALVVRLVRPSTEPLVLAAVAAYASAAAVEAVARAGLRALCDGLAEGRIRPAMWMVALGLAVAAVLGAGLLALPVSRRVAAPVESGHPLAAYLLGMHLLDALFTATSAITCTGLSLGDVGTEFSRFGQLILLVLMEVGGLGMLLAGSALGWRIRHLLGWNALDEECDPAAVRRLLRVLACTAILVQVAGGVALYAGAAPVATTRGGVAGSGPAAASTTQESAVPGPCWWEGPQAARVLEAAFHSAAAFCGCGLTLSRNSMTGAADRTLLGVILPLMLLGSLGGPVLYDLMRRIIRRHGLGLSRLAVESRATILLTVAGVLGTALLLVLIETSRDCQLRFPGDRTPGRLMLEGKDPPAAGPAGAIVFSAGASPRAARERLAGMPDRQRRLRALFQAASARGPGLRAVRLDEPSLSPASQALLAATMFAGGGMGGASGGGRLTVLAVLAAALAWTGNPLRARSPLARELGRYWAVSAAGVILAGMVGLVMVCAVVLIYRESASPGACLFEAVSACCNVGLSTGMTAALSAQSKAVLIVTMLAGRALPVVVLLRCLSWMPPGPQRGERLRPPVVPVHDEGPIPLA